MQSPCFKDGGAEAFRDEATRSRCELEKEFRSQPARTILRQPVVLGKSTSKKQHRARELQERGLFSKVCSLEQKDEDGWLG